MRLIILRSTLRKGTTNIRTFLISCIAAAIIAVCAAATLYQYQEPVAVAFSTSAVRI
jgi:uncharacterized membrane protein YfcA